MGRGNHLASLRLPPDKLKDLSPALSSLSLFSVECVCKRLMIKSGILEAARCGSGDVAVGTTREGHVLSCRAGWTRQDAALFGSGGGWNLTHWQKS